MKLVIGLGNIGNEYELTRHNIGFMCLDKFASVHKLEVKSARKYSYYKYKDCLLIKPKTFMNLSGDAYLSALHKYLDFEEELVIMDDIELPVGQVRIRTSGGDGGHNGLKSILARIGTQDVPRLRIGIGRPKTITPRDYVLDKFEPGELETINQVLSLTAKWLDLYTRFGINKLLDEYSQWKKKPIPPEKDGINRPKEENDDKGL
ncbi:MAG: aminoacyl-tRNA hydrolase [ANME-2 cluster archaeon]|nr:MAG: aminoacyl-tRNA hydrolase [ANME-2 cluster archaeon]